MIKRLSVKDLKDLEGLEDLAQVLLDFATFTDLTNCLKNCWLTHPQ
jgi:hypothetical protein